MVFSFETINGNLLPHNGKINVKKLFTTNGMNGNYLYYIMVNMVLRWMVWMGNAYITSW